MADDYATPEEKRAKRRAEKAAKAKQAQDNSVVASLLGSAAGRVWMWDLLGFCTVFQTVANSNPHFTYLNEGRRQVGLKLLESIMLASPTAYIQMMQEQADAGREQPLDKRDFDDDRNYDGSGRWIGEGDGPDDAEGGWDSGA